MTKLMIQSSKLKRKSPLSETPPVEVTKKVNKSAKKKLAMNKNEPEESTDREKKKRKLSDSESPKRLKIVSEDVTGDVKDLIVPKKLKIVSEDVSEDVSGDVKDLKVPKKLKIVSEDVSEAVTGDVKDFKVPKKLKIVSEALSGDVKDFKVPVSMTMEDAVLKYPVLNDQELVQRYQAVPITNNQKGRIRQKLRDFFKSSSSEKDPDVINMRLSDILRRSEKQSDSDHRQIRVLHNMLRTAVKEMIENKASPKIPEKKKKKKNKKAEKTNNKEEDEDGTEEAEVKVSETGEKQARVKGPKRYVVFVGNLPYDVEKDSIMRHFSQIVSKIKDVRIPKKKDDKKGGIAYLELADEPSYQMALSRHHSMLENRRINVLYTTTGKSKIDKAEAKGKTAKLIALQKTGKLLGSTPLNRKRSARRKKMRDAQAKQQSQ